jgi:hypothetical protein
MSVKLDGQTYNAASLATRLARGHHTVPHGSRTLTPHERKTIISAATAAGWVHPSTTVAPHTWESSGLPSNTTRNESSQNYSHLESVRHNAYGNEYSNTNSYIYREAAEAARRRRRARRVRRGDQSHAHVALIRKTNKNAENYRTQMAVKIQKEFLKRYYDPSHPIGKRRLRREFENLQRQ